MSKKSKQTVRCAVLFAIGLAIAGCEKTGVPTNVPETADAIPASLGDLVAVTPTDRRFESVLWFKQPDQTIVAVHVDLSRGTRLVYKTKYPRG